MTANFDPPPFYILEEGHMGRLVILALVSMFLALPVDTTGQEASSPRGSTCPTTNFDRIGEDVRAE